MRRVLGQAWYLEHIASSPRNKLWTWTSNKPYYGNDMQVLGSAAGVSHPFNNWWWWWNLPEGLVKISLFGDCPFDIFLFGEKCSFIETACSVCFKPFGTFSSPSENRVRVHNLNRNAKLRYSIFLRCSAFI